MLEVKHRLVTSDDWLFILEIRNEEEVRKVSFNSDIIDLASHIKYMKKLEKMSDVYHRIITLNGSGVGYIKVVNNDISYMVKKEFRGKGIMKSSFKIVFDDLKRLGKSKVKAAIMANNYPSLKLVEKAGFVMCETIYKNNEPYSFVLEKIL
jgi:RimJ/RimL family protein N-acetyltransferase